MAVYKRSFTAYAGPLTNPRFRFSIPARYALQTIFESRSAMTLFTACFIPHLIALAFIYLRSNLGAVEQLDTGFPAAKILEYFSVDGMFFAWLLSVENLLTFFAIATIAPGLVSPDLANNALPLYLSRPFSKGEYIAGKFATLAALCSAMTWIPALLLVAAQVSLAGVGWIADRPRVIPGIVAGSCLWIVTVSLVALAISAWVKWKPVAIASLFGMFFVGAAFGEVANGILSLDPRWGTLLNLRLTMSMVWDWFLAGNDVYFGAGGTEGIPAWTGLVSMLSLSALSYGLLAWKIRASEVVRG
jgi:ABC-2 type transport system permease protein